MSVCKQCGASYSYWNSPPGQLCPDCLKAKAASEQDQLQAALSPYTTKIRDIAAAEAAGKKVLHVALICWDMKEVDSGWLRKVPGIIGGLALGGGVGEMIFGGTLLSDTSTYAGQLGLLIVTADFVQIAFTEVVFLSNKCGISPNHIKYLAEQSEKGALQHYSLSLESIQIIEETGRILLKNTSTTGLRLYTPSFSMKGIRGSVCLGESPKNVCAQIAASGGMPEPSSLVKNILANKPPVTPTQVEKIVKDRPYMRVVARCITIDKERDGIVAHLPVAGDVLKQAIESALRDTAATYEKERRLFKVLTFIIGLSLLCIVVSPNVVVTLLLIITAICVAFFDLAHWLDARRALWCRETLK